MINISTSLPLLASSTGKEFLKEQGNIKPEQLYKIIVFDNRKPDFLAIDLYSDIRSWYKPKKTTEKNGKISYASKLKSGFYKTSYCYLSKRYHVSKETIRCKLVKLEDLGMLSRAFTTEKRYYEREENNILNILIWKETPYFKTNIGLEKSKELLNLCYRKTSVGELQEPPGEIGQLSPNETGDIYSNTNNSFSNNFKKDLIDSASESNFNKNSLEKGEGDKLSKSKSLNIVEVKQPLSTETCSVAATNLIDKVKIKFSGYRRKPIVKYYPLTEGEAKDLQISSGREFNLSYINKLVEKLGNKYPEHGFYTRAKFLEYLSKVLTNELRQESMVNNKAFRFGQDGEESKITQYLNGIEDCKDTSKIAQLRRKIAATFEKQTAYKLLVSCYFNETSDKSKFEIKKRSNFEITEFVKNKLLNEVRSVFGEQIEELVLINSGSKQENLEGSAKPSLNLGEENTIWNKVSKKLLEIFGEGVHASWFSRLEAQEENQTITLKAPSSFIGNWVESNYLTDIIKVTHLYGHEPYLIRVTV